MGAQAARNGFDGYLVVLGDLPLFQPADIDAIVEESQHQSIVLVPSDDGGTAALLRRPPDQIPARFGPASANAHREEARSRNLEPGQVPLISPAICVDLDTPEDADLILERGQHCHTLELLRKFKR